MANPESKQLAVDIIARVDKLEKGMAKAKHAANDNYKKIETRGQVFQKRMSAIGVSAFGGFAAGITATLAPLALFHKTLQAISETSSLAKVADKVGVAVEDLQRLQYGFGLAGVEVNNVDTAMQRFSRRVADAANGGGELVKIFKANNIELRDGEGKMRSQVDILRDYADLIKNAGSDQERLLLAFKAFDTEGASLVNALKGGADGVDTLMRKVDDAGGVIDEKLVRKSEDLDDKFAALWHNFDVNSNRAFLTAASAIDELIKSANDFGNSDFFKWLSGKLGSDKAVFVPGEGVFNEGDKQTPSSRVARAFLGEQQQADAELVEALKKRYGQAVEAAKPKATVIPQSDTGGGNGSSRSAAIAAANRQAEAVLQVISTLEEERRLVGATDAERAKSNALRLAGAAATDEQKAKIETLVEAIYREREAHEKNAEAMRELNDLGRDATRTLIDGFVEGKKAGEVFADVLSDIARRLEDMALDSLFGGKGGGALLGATFNLNLRRAA